jgi:nucleotide-binding universal stress UspA family protein
MEEAMFTNLLLAGDLSEHSQHAARAAGEMARAMDASHLCIVVAFPPVHGFLGEPNFDKVAAARLIEAEAVVAAAKKEIGVIPGEFQVEIIEGQVADVILQVAETHASDLIVMGSRHLGTLGHLLARDSSQRVADEAPCPVLIVR